MRRNTFLLSASLAVNSATLQLAAAVASLTFVEVTGVVALLGLGPAIFLTSAADGAPGRACNGSIRRVPVLAAGFGVGALGGLVTGLGARMVSTTAVIAGFVLRCRGRHRAPRAYGRR